MTSVELLAGVPPDVRQELMNHMTTRSFARRQRLWLDGESADNVSFVVDGWVKLVMLEPDGREVAVQLSGPGAMLCSGAVGGEGAYCCSAIAAQAQTRIMMIPREPLVELMSRNPSVLRALLDALGNRARQGCARVVDLGGLRVEQRLARVLTRLVEQAGIAQLDGTTKIPVALTRQDLADLCATTVETTIRIMRRLEHDGAVTTHSDGFVVHDRAKLSALSGA